MQVFSVCTHAHIHHLRTPCTEGIGLFPIHSHYWVVVIGRVREIQFHISLVVGIVKVVHPACGVGVHVHDICIQEIPWSAQGTSYCLAHNFAIVVYPCCILGYHHHLVFVHLVVGIQVPLSGIETILALCCHGIVIDFITIVHLTCIKHPCAIYGMCYVHTFYSTQFILCCSALRGYWLVPVQMWRYRFSIAILFNFVGFIAAVCRIRQSFTDYTVSNPIHKLSVLGIAHLVLVHPETVHTDVTTWEGRTP